MEREKPEHKKECRMLYIDLDLTSARHRLHIKELLDKFGTLDDISQIDVSYAVMMWKQ